MLFSGYRYLAYALFDVSLYGELAYYRYRPSTYRSYCYRYCSSWYRSTSTIMLDSRRPCHTNVSKVKRLEESLFSLDFVFL
uniref:Uncharacterized protein n=1 Tax=Utricularia reniformis TaxID=192314 RepID=A0A1Y0AYP8_9LAMI|nr:hypothetical protein AEK19_MT0405 [Utricularia reniformis]ART30279.1 hypothetical protein AEK19_MT0405 [Utricularia reniformis]